jgi:simple sugar transport system permease protein
MNDMTQIIALINAAVVFGTVILFGATGEILTEKSGNLNLGVPGIMYLGGIAGLVSAPFFYEANGNAGNPTPGMAVLLSMLCAFGSGSAGRADFQLPHHRRCGPIRTSPV